MEDLISLKDMKFPQGCPKIEFYREPTYCEICLYLFTKCNLRCEFCFQDHTGPSEIIDEEYFNSLPSRAIDLMKAELKAHSSIERFTIRMLGGEIFADDIPDELFEKYGQIITSIRTGMAKLYPSLIVDFVCTSNGVWKNRDRVKNFLNKYSFKKIISISIDFIGRYPSDSVKQTAYDTMYSLAMDEFFVRAGIVLTKRNIKYMLENREEVKDLVRKYKAEQIVFNYYSPNQQWELDLPSDDDLWEIYKFCIDERMFNVSTVFYMLESYRRQNFFTKTCECKFIPTVTPDVCTKDCAVTASPLPRERFYGKYTDEVTEENVSDVKASLGIVKRGCLACEHYKYCSQPCWCMLIFDGYKTTSCPMQRAFNYIKENPQIMKDYEEWARRDKNFR